MPVPSFWLLFWPVGILFLHYNLVELNFVLFQLLFWNKTQTFTSWCLIHGWKLGIWWGARICYYGKTGGSLGSQSRLTRRELGTRNPTLLQHLVQGHQDQLHEQKCCSWCLLHKKRQVWRFKDRPWKIKGISSGLLPLTQTTDTHPKIQSSPQASVRTYVEGKINTQSL